VSICYVLHVCEVEEIVVLADLELGLAILEGLHHFGKQLYVSFAKDAGGADGASEEVLGRAVRFENGRFGIGLVL